jgi:hypothetical protein
MCSSGYTWAFPLPTRNFFLDPSAIVSTCSFRVYLPSIFLGARETIKLGALTALDLYTTILDNMILPPDQLNRNAFFKKIFDH